MRKLLFIAFGCLSLFSACDEDDGGINPCVDMVFEDPFWMEDVQVVATTNTPTVQIDRFVAANNLDTVHTSSGLVYSLLEEGSSERPDLNSVVVTWYRGYTVDGAIFDQSTICNGPLELPLENLIPGWREGIPKIGRGGKMILFARPSLAYENNSPSNGTRVLVFEIELLDFG